MFKRYDIKDIFVGRFKKDEDLFIALKDFLKKNNIKNGIIEGIGAVQNATVGYYNQTEKVYHSIEINEPMEVLTLTGNISLKEGEAFPHCHITLGDYRGNVKGGHLLEGCKVFAFEFTIMSFDGAALIRSFDPETHLPLWKFNY